jgi:hypothetical protein
MNREVGVRACALAVIVLYEPNVPAANIERRNWFEFSSTVSLREEFTDQSTADALLGAMLKHSKTKPFARFTMITFDGIAPYSKRPRSGTIMTSPA